MDRPYWVFGCKVTAFGYVHARRFSIPSAIWFAQFFCCCCCCSLTNYFPFVFFTFLHLFIITFLFYLSCERNNQIRFLKVARVVHHCQVLHFSWLFIFREKHSREITPHCSCWGHLVLVWSPPTIHTSH